MYTHKQALRMYRMYQVKVPVALGAQARTVRAQALRAATNAQRTAGLAELAAVSNPYHRRGIFETLVQFAARDLQVRSTARAVHLQ